MYRLKLEARDFTASAAGGMIEVTMSGAKVIKEVKLNPEVVDKDAIEDLQDVIGSRRKCRYHTD